MKGLHTATCKKRMALAALVVGASVSCWSGAGRAAEGAPVAQTLPQPEIASCLYGQTVFYDGLADERAQVKGKLEKVKTGADRWEANALDGLLKQKEEVLSDLTAHLEQMTGKKFAETNRLPATGIILARADSKNVPAELARRLEGKGLEAFLIHSEKTDRLWIVANDMRGLSHGVYYYLEQLGVRWLMSGKNWTVIPNRNGVAIQVDRLVEPSFVGRIYGSSFYSNDWGGRYKGSKEFQQEWLTWYRRMRMGGIGLGKSMGEAFVVENREVLAQHPEYLAKIDGKYTPLYLPNTNAALANYVWNGASNRFVKAAKPGTGTHQINEIAKLNAGNPEAVALFSDWILKKLRASKSGPQGYAVLTQSVEPADGGGEGNNYEELKQQGVGDGSESDQEFFIGNACARKIRQEFPDVSVVMLAYGAHSDQPSFPLEPNFIVQPCAWRGGRKTAKLNEDEWLAAWKAKMPKFLAMYDYWSIFDWTHDQPEFNYRDLAKRLRRFYSYNIKALDAETTHGGGAMGIGQYVGSHLMWDIDLDEKALIEDWYENAFGPAKAPMKRMMERWARQYRPISSELAYSYRDIDEAEQLAAGNAAVLARVDDYARYLHYLRLYDEQLAAPSLEKASRQVEYLLDINDSRMTHSTRTYDLVTLKQHLYPSLLVDFHLAKDANEKDGPGWARVHPLSHEEVAALIRDGLATYPLPDFVEKRYDGKPVPLKPIRWRTPGGDSWGVTMAIARGELDLQLPEGMAFFPMHLLRNQYPSRITIRDDAGKIVFDRAFDPEPGKDPSHWTWVEEKAPLAPGHYRVAIEGHKNGVLHFQTWKGMPVTWRTFWIQKQEASPKLFFYVPRGTPKIVLYFPVGIRVDASEPPIYDPSGTRIKVEHRDGGKLALMSVPAGMDGKIWSLDRLAHYYGPVETLTIPQAFALEPDVLLVPDDAR